MNTLTAYQIYKEIFGSTRFKRLADKGARVQRLLWASTGTKGPDYSDVKYVESLNQPFDKLMETLAQPSPRQETRSS